MQALFQENNSLPPKMKWIFRSCFCFGNNMMLVITKISKTFSDTLNYVRLGTQSLFSWYSSQTIFRKMESFFKKPWNTLINSMLQLNSSFSRHFKISETIAYFKEELYLLKCFRKAHRIKKKHKTRLVRWILGYKYFRYISYFSCYTYQL